MPGLRSVAARRRSLASSPYSPAPCPTPSPDPAPAKKWDQCKPQTPVPGEDEALAGHSINGGGSVVNGISSFGSPKPRENQNSDHDIDLNPLVTNVPQELGAGQDAQHQHHTHRQETEPDKSFLNCSGQRVTGQTEESLSLTVSEADSAQKEYSMVDNFGEDVTWSEINTTNATPGAGPDSGNPSSCDISSRATVTSHSSNFQSCSTTRISPECQKICLKNVKSSAAGDYIAHSQGSDGSSSGSDSSVIGQDSVQCVSRNQTGGGSSFAQKCTSSSPSVPAENSHVESSHLSANALSLEKRTQKEVFVRKESHSSATGQGETVKYQDRRDVSISESVHNRSSDNKSSSSNRAAMEIESTLASRGVTIVRRMVDTKEVAKTKSRDTVASKDEKYSPSPALTPNHPTGNQSPQLGPKTVLSSQTLRAAQGSTTPRPHHQHLNPSQINQLRNLSKDLPYKSTNARGSMIQHGPLGSILPVNNSLRGPAGGLGGGVLKGYVTNQRPRGSYNYTPRGQVQGNIKDMTPQVSPRGPARFTSPRGTAPRGVPSRMPPQQSTQSSTTLQNVQQLKTGGNVMQARVPVLNRCGTPMPGAMQPPAPHTTPMAKSRELPGKMGQISSPQQSHGGVHASQDPSAQEPVQAKPSTLSPSTQLQPRYMGASPQARVGEQSSPSGSLPISSQQSAVNPSLRLPGIGQPLDHPSMRHHPQQDLMQSLSQLSNLVRAPPTSSAQVSQASLVSLPSQVMPSGYPTNVPSVGFPTASHSEFVGRSNSESFPSAFNREYSSHSGNNPHLNSNDFSNMHSTSGGFPSQPSHLAFSSQNNPCEFSQQTTSTTEFSSHTSTGGVVGQPTSEAFTTNTNISNFQAPMNTATYSSLSCSGSYNLPPSNSGSEVMMYSPRQRDFPAQPEARNLTNYSSPGYLSSHSLSSPSNQRDLAINDSTREMSLQGLSLSTNSTENPALNAIIGDQFPPSSYSESHMHSGFQQQQESALHQRNNASNVAMMSNFRDTSSVPHNFSTFKQPGPPQDDLRGVSQLQGGSGGSYRSMPVNLGMSGEMQQEQAPLHPRTPSHQPSYKEPPASAYRDQPVLNNYIASPVHTYRESLSLNDCQELTNPNFRQGMNNMVSGEQVLQQQQTYRHPISPNDQVLLSYQQQQLVSHSNSPPDQVLQDYQRKPLNPNNYRGQQQVLPQYRENMSMGQLSSQEGNLPSGFPESVNTSKAQEADPSYRGTLNYNASYRDTGYNCNQQQQGNSNSSEVGNYLPTCRGAIQGPKADKTYLDQHLVVDSQHMQMEEQQTPLKYKDSASGSSHSRSGVLPSFNESFEQCSSSESHQQKNDSDSNKEFSSYQNPAPHPNTSRNGQDYCYREPSSPCIRSPDCTSVTNSTDDASGKTSNTKQPVSSHSRGSYQQESNYPCERVSSTSHDSYSPDQSYTMEEGEQQNNVCSSDDSESEVHPESSNSCAPATVQDQYPCSSGVSHIQSVLSNADDTQTSPHSSKSLKSPISLPQKYEGKAEKGSGLYPMAENEVGSSVGSTTEGQSNSKVLEKYATGVASPNKSESTASPSPQERIVIKMKLLHPERSREERDRGERSAGAAEFPGGSKNASKYTRWTIDSIINGREELSAEEGLDREDEDEEDEEEEDRLGREDSGSEEDSRGHKNRWREVLEEGAKDRNLDTNKNLMKSSLRITIANPLRKQLSSRGRPEVGYEDEDSDEGVMVKSGKRMRTQSTAEEDSDYDVEEDLSEDEGCGVMARRKSQRVRHYSSIVIDSDTEPEDLPLPSVIVKKQQPKKRIKQELTPLSELTPESTCLNTRSGRFSNNNSDSLKSPHQPSPQRSTVSASDASAATTKSLSPCDESLLVEGLDQQGGMDIKKCSIVIKRIYSADNSSSYSSSLADKKAGRKGDVGEEGDIDNDDKEVQNVNNDDGESPEKELVVVKDVNKVDDKKAVRDFITRQSARKLAQAQAEFDSKPCVRKVVIDNNKNKNKSVVSVDKSCQKKIKLEINDKNNKGNAIKGTAVKLDHSAISARPKRKAAVEACVKWHKSLKTLDTSDPKAIKIPYCGVLAKGRVMGAEGSKVLAHSGGRRVLGCSVVLYDVFMNHRLDRMACPGCTRHYSSADGVQVSLKKATISLLCSTCRWLVVKDVHPHEVDLLAPS